MCKTRQRSLIIRQQRASIAVAWHNHLHPRQTGQAWNRYLLTFFEPYRESERSWFVIEYAYSETLLAERSPARSNLVLAKQFVQAVLFDLTPNHCILIILGLSTREILRRLRFRYTFHFCRKSVHGTFQWRLQLSSGCLKGKDHAAVNILLSHIFPFSNCVKRFEETSGLTTVQTS